MTVHKLTDETRKQAIAYCDYYGGGPRVAVSREAVDVARTACERSRIGAYSSVVEIQPIAIRDRLDKVIAYLTAYSEWRRKEPKP